MIRVTVHVGDEVYEVGLITGPDPELVAMMVRDWADSFEDPEGDL